MKPLLILMTCLFSLGKTPGKSSFPVETSTDVIKQPVGSSELKEFKSFANRFFAAVKTKDTVFLKAHIVFPITHSSFLFYDHELNENTKIDARLLFKKLHKLFPDDLISKIAKKAEFGIFDHKGTSREYRIEIMFNDGGVDSNVNWFFIKKQNVFYFTTFTAEAG
jgi:hypothetical protein